MNGMPLPALGLINEEQLLRNYPSSPTDLDHSSFRSVDLTRKFLIVIDDDPTGSQAVADIPLLTSWQETDLHWALSLRYNAVFILTNTRSVDAETAAARNAEVVSNALKVATRTRREISFLSRSDSTMRGYFAEETGAIIDANDAAGSVGIDATVLIPAFPDAGRITIGGVHYVRVPGGLLPVGESEFAQDVSFGFKSSDLRGYIVEKTNGGVSRESITLLDLSTVRTGAQRISTQLLPLSDRAMVVADSVTDNDLRELALGLALAEAEGKKFLYRTGPAFVAARLGMDRPAPIQANSVLGSADDRAGGGLIVAGSHVNLTNRQLARLTQGMPELHELELSVDSIMDTLTAPKYLSMLSDKVVHSLGEGDVLLRTSRQLKVGVTARESLAIARTVSEKLAAVVLSTVQRLRPRFVIAKGGITSNDVAVHGLQIRRAIISGPMLQGIVSVWQPIGGLADGIPFVVFPGNVGSESDLLAVVRSFSSYSPTVSGTPFSQGSIRH